MENYIPTHLIEEYFECDLSKHKENWSAFDVPNHLKGVAMEDIRNHREREKAIKRILNSTLTKRITADSLKEHGVYDEIEGWFKEISEMYQETAILVK